jgi:hypothetical protein
VFIVQWYRLTLHYQNPEDSKIPKSYIELLKQAGNVRRPFHCQAVALTLLCRELVTKFGNERHRTAENALSLELYVDSQFVPARAVPLMKVLYG